MSLQGRWRIVEMDAWDTAFVDLTEPAYILFGPTRGEFAFACVTGAFGGAGETDAVQFTWDGANEMDEAFGEAWAELQPDGSVTGEIEFHNGDESTFIAQPWATSSTAC